MVSGKGAWSAHRQQLAGQVLDPPLAASALSAGTRLLLSRLPVIVLAADYVIVFLLHRLPELAGVGALAQVGKQASVLVWATLPGLSGTGAAGG